MVIEFYKNLSDDRVVDKSITLVGSVEGELKEKVGILNPVIRFELETLPNFNYIRIPDFGGRYYFLVGEPVCVSKNIWDVSFKHDVLMNLKLQFRNLSGIVERQENVKNDYLIDGSAPVEVNTQLFMVRGDGSLSYWSDGAEFLNKNYVVLMSAAGIDDDFTNAGEEEEV